ncbi:HEAT repeat domain-containing protein [Streptomyces sp. NPDC002920]
MDANAAALIAQAGQLDAGDRAEAACGLATAVTGREDDPAVGALIRLTQDAAPDVRDQATFAPGTPAPTDGPAVRAAPRARLDDSDPDTREEAVRGLALRRDPRAVPLLTGLLAADSAHPHTFRAVPEGGPIDWLPESVVRGIADRSAEMLALPDIEPTAADTPVSEDDAPPTRRRLLVLASAAAVFAAAGGTAVWAALHDDTPGTPCSPCSARPTTRRPRRSSPPTTRLSCRCCPSRPEGCC